MPAITACPYCRKITDCDCRGELVPSSKAELAEAITNLAATAARLPIHFTEKRAVLHDRINVLLTLHELSDE